jgi:hypothetical protein
MSRPWYETTEGAVAFCVALEALRSEPGNSVTILCDNEDAEVRQEQSAVEVTAHWTEWQPERYLGTTPLDAILAAGREQARHR